MSLPIILISVKHLQKKFNENKYLILICVVQLFYGPIIPDYFQQEKSNRYVDIQLSSDLTFISTVEFFENQENIILCQESMHKMMFLGCTTMTSFIKNIMQLQSWVECNYNWYALSEHKKLPGNKIYSYTLLIKMQAKEI